ncbi:hypothetical protein J1614_002221 [Plenodomus biglobosus]|nr:hypothetical protein J1614_002221 [Plenodomus biglobosus]
MYSNTLWRVDGDIVEKGPRVNEHILLSSSNNPQPNINPGSTGGENPVQNATATDMSLGLQNKIAGVQRNVQYFEEQLVAADMDFKEVLNTRTIHENNGTMDE